MNQPTGIRRLFGVVAELLELQLELLAVDAKELTRRSVAVIVMVVVATIFGSAAITAAVFAVASLFHEIAEWSISNSLLAAAGLAALMAGLFVTLSWRLLKQVMSTLSATRSEFTENLRWIKAEISFIKSSPKVRSQEKSSNGRYTSAGRE